MKKSIWKRLSSCESRINHLENDFSMNFMDYSYMKLRMERIIRSRSFGFRSSRACCSMAETANGRVNKNQTSGLVGCLLETKGLRL